MNAMTFETRLHRARDRRAILSSTYGDAVIAARLQRKADADAAWAATLVHVEPFQPPKAPAGGWKSARPEIGDVDDGRFDDEQEEGGRL